MIFCTQASTIPHINMIIWALINLITSLISNKSNYNAVAYSNIHIIHVYIGVHNSNKQNLQ